jgi:hypothetical protein
MPLKAREDSKMIAVLPKEYGPDYSDRCSSFTRDPYARTSLEDRCGTCLSEGSCVDEEIMLLLDVMNSYLNLVRKPNATGAIVDLFEEKCWNRIAELLGENDQRTPKRAESYGDSVGEKLNRLNRYWRKKAWVSKKNRRHWTSNRIKREKLYWKTILNDIHYAEVY